MLGNVFLKIMHLQFVHIHFPHEAIISSCHAYFPQVPRLLSTALNHFLCLDCCVSMALWGLSELYVSVCHSKFLACISHQFLSFYNTMHL